MTQPEPAGLTSNHCSGKKAGLIGESAERLRLFLHESVKSYEEIEALLFLARNEGREFGAEDVTAALNAAAGSLHEALEALANAGRLVHVAPSSTGLRYRYAPIDESTRRLVTELEAAYAEQRMSVMQMLSTNALDRVRRAAMLRFANAFRLERSKK
jgi:hypothetical protein